MTIAHGRAGANTSDAVELEAIYQGLVLAGKKGSYTVEVNTDSSTVINYLKMENPPWKVRKLVQKTEMKIDK